jgi:hypothetical protein
MAATKITIGNGQTARFWTDRWLDDMTPQEIALELFKISIWKKIDLSKRPLQIGNGYRTCASPLTIATPRSFCVWQHLSTKRSSRIVRMKSLGPFVARTTILLDLPINSSSSARLVLITRRLFGIDGRGQDASSSFGP